MYGESKGWDTIPDQVGETRLEDGRPRQRGGYEPHKDGNFNTGIGWKAFGLLDYQWFRS